MERAGPENPPLFFMSYMMCMYIVCPGHVRCCILSYLERRGSGGVE